MSTAILTKADELINQANTVIMKQSQDMQNRKKIAEQLQATLDELGDGEKRLEDLARAATLLGNVSDENTKATLDFITNVINKALGTMFKEDGRRISIKQVMYRNVYPHFIVELETADGHKRTFKQSGTGLAQIISFLFTVCLIDARKGRKVMVMDELLNGLHPDAKLVIRDLIKALSKHFQFVIVEYGLDLGKQYEIAKTGSYANVGEYQGQGYYRDLSLNAIKAYKEAKEEREAKELIGEPHTMSMEITEEIED